MRMIEKDLEALLQVEDFSSPDLTHEELGPSLTLEQATKLFDELMAVRMKPERLSRAAQWTEQVGPDSRRPRSYIRNRFAR